MSDEPTIRDEDLEWHVWPLRPVGGQHTNVHRGGVLLVHKPTGYAVVCESERSQHGNRMYALSRMADLLSVDIVDRVERDASMAIAAWLDRAPAGVTSVNDYTVEAIRARQWKTSAHLAPLPHDRHGG